MKNTTFVVDESGLHSGATIKKLKLENDDYSIVVFYFGEYDEDKNNGTISTGNLSMSCHSKMMDLPLISMTADAEVVLDVPPEPVLRLMDVEMYKGKIDDAHAAADEVQQIMYRYFR